MTEAADPASPRLPYRIVLAYGAPSLASVAIAIVMGIHLPIFYSDTVLVPLGAIALVKAIVRAFDAVTDLPMGWLSDKTRSRWGRRRPWIAVGAPLAAVCFWALFSPPADLEGLAAVGWLGVTYALFYLGHTAYIIPHYGLGAELTNDYHERTRLFGWREGFVIAGTLIAAIVPSLLEDRLGSSRAAFASFGSVTAILLVALYWNLVRVVPERAEYQTRPANPLVPGIRRSLFNPVFRIVLLAQCVHAITAGIPPVMTPYFLKYVIEPDNFSLWFAIYMAAYFGAAFLTLPFWMYLSHRRGKRFAWMASLLPGIIACLGLFQMGPGDVIPAVLIIAFAGTGFAPSIFLMQAILADVIDYDELHTGKRREAQYTAFWSFLQKFAVIPSASVPLAILAAAGFVANAPQNETVRLTIRMIYGLAPAAIGVVTFLVAWRYPLSAAVHAKIREGIAQHGRGEPAIDPLTGCSLPPPRSSEEDESSWFLDHFSSRELAAIPERGPGWVRRRTAIATLASLALCTAAVLAAAHEIGNWEQDPGVSAVFWIIAAGVGFTGVIYHGVRFAAARKLIAAPPSASRLAAHRAAQESAWAPQAAPGR